VIVSSIFGCTLVYSIPVGLGFLSETDRPYFTRGILIGLISMPFSIIAACQVSTINIFGAHFAFTNSMFPEMVPAMVAAKFVGGLVGGTIAMLATRNTKSDSE